jgi:cephalosporin hydroxylase
VNEEFRGERETSIRGYAKDSALQDAAHAFFLESARARYSYNFDWLSRPIIQYPQDIVALQEVIWRVRPDIVIETGIAHGGSLVLSASILALLDYCDAAQAGETIDPRRPRRRVLGLDIDIRPHNRAAIEAHPLSPAIEMIEGSSIDPGVISRVRARAKDFPRVLVCLDSNHTHEHVLAELEAYAPLVTEGSYCCVFDTVIENMPADAFPDRPWGRGDNPMTAVHEYLSRLSTSQHPAADGRTLRFELDELVNDKLLVTVAPHGWLRRVAA